MYNLPAISVAFYFVLNHLCLANDWHYSLSSMYDLLNWEIDHIITAEKYINNEYQRLENIRRFIEQREIQNANELAASYTESSINAFKTILRIKNDWETLKNEMAQTTVMEKFQHSLVTNDSVVSALKALRRLQIVYELELHEITSGKIGVYTFDKFNADDCYQMASFCYDNAEFHCAYHWFDEVYKKYKQDNSTFKNDYTTFVTKHVWSCYLVGDVEKAKNLVRDYYNEGREITENISNSRYLLWGKKQVFKRNTANDHDKKFYSHSLRKLDSNGEVRNFKTACRKLDLDSRYNCRYYHGGRHNKFLIIAPLREETVSIIPNMKLYHNVLYENEIKKIKELARPRLERNSFDTEEDISLRKETLFWKYQDQVFETLHNRMSQISPKREHSPMDGYIVTNYGLAGHYLPHTKHIDDDHLINSKGRQAVIIFHMDDVPSGGSTVLPDVEVRVPSIKGSALIIHNTRRIKTPLGMLYRHAQYGSCPIFYGDKWTVKGWLQW